MSFCLVFWGCCFIWGVVLVVGKRVMGERRHVQTHTHTKKPTNSIGKSAQGRDIWALEISDAPGTLEPEPAFKYVGNMHGDEPSGRQLLLRLAEALCVGYGKDADATRLVNGVHLYIIPTMNPDGFAARGRNNAAGVDLNRDFPDPWKDGAKGGGADLRAPKDGAQPETKAMMAFTLAVGCAFVLFCLFD